MFVSPPRPIHSDHRKIYRRNYNHFGFLAFLDPLSHLLVRRGDPVWFDNTLFEKSLGQSSLWQNERGGDHRGRKTSGLQPFPRKQAGEQAATGRSSDLDLSARAVGSGRDRSRPRGVGVRRGFPGFIAGRRWLAVALAALAVLFGLGLADAVLTRVRLTPAALGICSNFRTRSSRAPRSAA